MKNSELLTTIDFIRKNIASSNDFIDITTCHNLITSHILDKYSKDDNPDLNIIILGIAIDLNEEAKSRLTEIGG